MINSMKDLEELVNLMEKKQLSKVTVHGVTIEREPPKLELPKFEPQHQETYANAIDEVFYSTFGTAPMNK